MQKFYDLDRTLVNGKGQFPMPRILVIEDDDDSREVLATLLTRAGYIVAEARNGREAIVQLRTEPPDVVLTDLVMPEQDGLGVILMMRKEMPATPVIAMSGGRLNASFYLDLANRLGAKKLLTKPFTSEQLFKAIQSVTLPPPALDVVDVSAAVQSIG